MFSPSAGVFLQKVYDSGADCVKGEGGLPGEICADSGLSKMPET